MKTPGPDHPIDLTPQEGRVVVRHGGAVIADSVRALALREAALPLVFYIPREDVAMDRLARSSRTSHCPYKGDASYWSLPGAPEAAWSYETPFPAVAPIAGLIAFWRGRVDEIAIEPA